jgi:hypothetical protein
VQFFHFSNDLIVGKNRKIECKPRFDELNNKKTNAMHQHNDTLRLGKNYPIAQTCLYT